MPLDLAQHPCFNPSAAGHAARIHLPVAEKCNVQCNFCNRRYDCVNESRPGVTSALLQPRQAAEYLGMAIGKEPRIRVVGIAGPGDPFAEPQATLQTMRFVRDRNPDLLLCVASNGLNVAPYLDELATLSVSHVTITVNAVDPTIGARIYAWVRDGRSIHRGHAGASLLLERQLEAIAGLKARGITVKVNSILIPTVNDHHVADVARTVAALGADKFNCIPMHPAADTVFEDLGEPSPQRLAAARQDCEQHLPQMRHCARCRADAVGLLSQDRSGEMASCLAACASGATAESAARPFIAVASWEGMLVNQHLGEARQLWIFEQRDGGYALLDRRDTPPAGGGGQRWLDLADQLSDCRALLVASVGAMPRSILAVKGIRVVEMDGMIEEGLSVIYAGGDPRTLSRRKSKACAAGSSSCGDGCTGAGTGCG